ncbi:hypothetical protein LCGC14_1053860 [marine sediment metagenome]|uniref:Polymerase nucleotidyl transferase domain-containing protein n=1 Tax=marine sediment metagenome TaxID=412755 RepID=A0A0F9MSJ9_9ZZZZ
MNREQKIAYATRYAAELVARHAGIAGIVLGGSVARGNDLPISDVDLWCFVDDAHRPLPVEKHSEGDLYIDVDQRAASELVRLDVADDPYFCGYVHDALILFDRDGDVGKCRNRARQYLAAPLHREKQLASIRESVERNHKNLAASAQAHDAREACRTSIFAAWSLCDYMLTAKGVSPGGARGIARLAVAWPDAANALIEFEGAEQMDQPQIDSLIQTYQTVAGAGSFFEMWFSKVKWMFANGYGSDALHALWIALGLRIKGAPNDLRDLLDVASSHWLDTIGWNWDTVLAKSHQLRGMIDRFCIPSEDKDKTATKPDAGDPDMHRDA